MRASELFEREPVMRRSQNSRYIDFDFEVGKKGEHKTVFVVVGCRYNLGGVNYFSGGMIPRGFRTSVTVETVEDDGSGMTSRSFWMGQGIGGIFPEAATRFSMKRLDEYAPRALDYVRAIADDPRIQAQVDQAVAECQQEVAV